MKHILTFIAASALLVATSCNPEVREAKSLARRIMGPSAKQIVFEQIPADTADIYELETVGNKVVIRGNNSNAMAVGLNRYLQFYCLTNVSWYDYNPVELPETLPLVPEKVSASAKVKYRFFLNYCTFGYTMPWWKWQQWERFIDWMALNGVNMPLAITGQEAVWQKVWRKYGMTDDQIREFFTGPAHLPWQRMCNLDKWQGPLPQSWIDGQAKLQKKILRRERALGMTPVLPGFAGHVPQLLEETCKGCETYRVSYWGGFADQYRCTFLSPMDPLFAQIQKDFLEEQTRMYGTDHIYGVDPFNEVDAPFWDPETLAKISSGIYASMAAVDPEAIWLQMGWIFIADPAHWNTENARAYLTAVPQGKMIILDYTCDVNPIWKIRDKFYGQPFIGCLLGNFGGMTGIEDGYHQNSDWIADAFENAGPGFQGIGSTLEGFGVNEPLYEFVMSKAWETGICDHDYLDNIADRHLGAVDENYREAVHFMDEKIRYIHGETDCSSVLCAHPSLESQWHWTTLYHRAYDINLLPEVLEMLDKVQGTSNYLEYDKANIARQCLNNKSETLRDAFTAAYRAGDLDAMDAAAQAFLDNCDAETSVLSTRKEFSLDQWLEDARSWGRTAEEKDYFEMNARTLITVWGDSFHLCDYANREWDGLVDTYYKVRWQMFFDAVRTAFRNGEPFANSSSTGYTGVSESGTDPNVTGPALQFDRDIWDFECRWAKVSTKQYNENYIWISSGANFGVMSDPDSIYYYMSKIKASGFDNVVVETKSITGEVMYQSSLAPYFKSFGDTERADDYDMFGNVIKICHKLGMRAFAGIDVFAGGHNHLERGIIFNDHPQWQTICYIDGEFKPVTEVKSTYDGMVNAASPEIQDYELAVLQEFVRKYPECDGIIMDRVRFESMVADFSDVSRTEFEKWSGMKLENWPEDIIRWETGATDWSRGPYFNQWCEWRSSVICDFIKRVYSSLKEINPRLIVGDYAGAWYPVYYQVGVNWASPSYDPSEDYDWATASYRNTGYAGYLDLLMTGLYYTEITEDERPDEPYYTVRGGAQMVKDVTCGEVPLVGSIYISMYDNDMSRLPLAIRQSVESTGGVMVFDLVHIRHRNLWDDIKSGVI